MTGGRTGSQTVNPIADLEIWLSTIAVSLLIPPVAQKRTSDEVRQL